MDAVALDADAELRRRESLLVDLPHLRAVERVGEVRAELLDVEMFHPPADLLVDGEADTDRRVLDLRMLREVRDGRHDLGHARFVVGP